MKRENAFRLLLLLALVCNAPAVKGRGVQVNCLMANTGSQVYEDASVRLSLQVLPEGLAQLVLQNKTSRPIDVDLARSFGYVEGRSFALYVPGSRTESHTRSYGTLSRDPLRSEVLPPSDTYYGESQTRSQTVENLAIQPVAPGGMAVIYEFEALPSQLNPALIDLGRRGGPLRFGRRGHFISPLAGQGGTGLQVSLNGQGPRDGGATGIGRQKFRRGAACAYSEAGSPLHLSAYVQYSFGGADGVLHPARVSDYVRQIVVGGNCPATGGFCFRSGGGNGLISAEMGLGAAFLGIFAVTASRWNSVPSISF